jgi:hypothetical protein
MTETSPTSQPEDLTSKGGRGRKAEAWIAALSVVFLLALIVGGVSFAGPAVRAEWVAQHGPAAIGIPAAILIATIVVSGARALDGEAGLTFLGVVVTGGSALALLWLAVFAAVVLAIRTLW